MDPRAIVASLPLLRRAWRFLPGPLRIPLLVVGAGIFVWRRMTGRDVAHPDGGASTEAARFDDRRRSAR